MINVNEITKFYLVGFPVEEIRKKPITIKEINGVSLHNSCMTIS